jgi:ATP synthase protein I
MPRTNDRARRELLRASGEAWTMVTELLTATAVWAGIGYGLDVWLGTKPVLLVIGAVVGHAAGIYLVVLRTRRMSERAQAMKDERGGMG